MSLIAGAAATTTGTIVTSAVGGVVLAAVLGTSLTQVAKSVTADDDASAKISNINEPRYADQ
jgi:hypothetical protein